VRPPGRAAIETGQSEICVRTLYVFLFLFTVLIVPFAAIAAQSVESICSRAESGTEIVSPSELRSRHGLLRTTLSIKNSVGSDGHMRYCYVAEDGNQSPTLRLSPGDLLVLTLKNDISLPATAMKHVVPPSNSCSSGMDLMSASSTNLHFHGLAIPPKCHADETITTAIPSAGSTFEYRFQVPSDTPPGLYWYHPHVHGFSEEQVLGGASGALIVEGIERANKLIAGLSERILVIRDQRLSSSKSDPNRPGKDLSVNFAPVVFPDFKPAVIRMHPTEREFWRVLNASADTYLDIKVVFNDAPQFLGVVALDGVPIGYADGGSRNRILWESHVFLSPAGRAEFVLNGPPAGMKAALMAQAVETGPTNDSDSRHATVPAKPQNPVDDDNTPSRTLVNIVSYVSAPEVVTKLPMQPTVQPDTPSARPLSTITPTRQRKLYFSEKVPDPGGPNSPTVFYITEDGKIPTAYDPFSTTPNIVVHQGDVEDWLIENRSQETHAFHIHQTHFLVLERHGVPVHESYLRDTINVPYWDGFSPQYPSIKLRMDFRDKNIVGTFPYHCHILQHEDGGMMGTIRVEPAITASDRTTHGVQVKQAK